MSEKSIREIIEAIGEYVDAKINLRLMLEDVKKDPTTNRFRTQHMPTSEKSYTDCMKEVDIKKDKLGRTLKKYITS